VLKRGKIGESLSLKEGGGGGKEEGRACQFPATGKKEGKSQKRKKTCCFVTANKGGGGKGKGGEAFTCPRRKKER